MECFIESMGMTQREKSILAHVATNVLEHVRLQRHVHVDSSNNQTKLPFDNIQYSRHKFRGAFSRGINDVGIKVSGRATHQRHSSTFSWLLSRRMPLEAAI
jgi:hypothetical protein